MTGMRAGLAWSVASVVATGLGFAVRYGEDNQVGETNAVSFYVFVAAGFCAYRAVLRFAILFLRHLKKRME